MACPVMPTWRACGIHPRSVTLRDAPNWAPSASRRGSSNGRSASFTPFPSPMTVPAACRAPTSSSRSSPVTWTRLARPECELIGIVPPNRAVRRGKIPGRTVAIWTGEVTVIAATTWPPNAGFQAIRRPSAALRSTASPTRPAPIAAAVRPATSRPQIVPGAKIAHGGSTQARSVRAAANTSSTRAFATATARSAPHAARV